MSEHKRLAVIENPRFSGPTYENPRSDVPLVSVGALGLRREDSLVAPSGNSADDLYESIKR